MRSECTWLFGRGASIANGLSWVVPEEWKRDLLEERTSREEHQKMIIETIRSKMFGITADCRPYRKLLDSMANRTIKGGHHKLVTTNWDYLLQNEVNNWIAENHPGVAPRFLSTNSSVLHLNGSAEPNTTDYRSPFLLETDLADYRRRSVEANKAFNMLLWSSLIVIVGMSFECDIDKGLLGALRVCGDEIPLGEAQFVVVDPGIETLQNTIEKIRYCFPRSRQVSLNMGFEAWVETTMPEIGIFV